MGIRSTDKMKKEGGGGLSGLHHSWMETDFWFPGLINSSCSIRSEMRVGGTAGSRAAK